MAKKIISEYKIIEDKRNIKIFNINDTKDIKDLREVQNINDTNDKLKTIKSKYNDKYLEINTKINKCAIGYINEKMYVGRVYHNQKLIVIREIDGFYFMRPKYCEQTSKEIKNGFVMIKSESKEKFEFRKKSLKYVLDRIENEEPREYKYCRSEDKCDYNAFPLNNNLNDSNYDNITNITHISNINDNSLSITTRNDSFKISQHTLHMKNELIKTIFRLKVINISIIKNIFNNLDGILEIIKEYCMVCRGRYILKDKFYEECLQDNRKIIIQQLKEKGYLETKYITKNNINLVVELCIKKNDIYLLKGEEEIEEIEETNNKDENIIYEIFKEVGICSIEYVIVKSGMEKEELIKILNNLTYKLINNSYVLKEGEENEIRNIFIAIFMKKRSFKRNEIFEEYFKRFNKELKIGVFSKVSKEFCTSKGGVWYLKDPI
ncbi:hypothetical protein CWI36_0592p0010 [Hamiltosporidium magnivora]|uniref:DNA-directed RNA polymerase III subunit RPC5 n=1 Tax=Hamiltosporidium magnivora TaxID=148818 RepID=A0A4Q9LCR5_9MICR|nr:hypothetical protein CWI36_0592p0010 [Hamiltosporidium magnivora]